MVGLSSYSQIKFTAQAPAQVDINSTFRLQFSINTDDISDFNGPGFKNFECLNGPARSSFSNFQMINGKTSSSSSVTYTYILSPKEKGRFTIPGATIKAKGKLYKSNSLTIVVSGNGSKQSSPRSSQGQSGDEAEGQIQEAGSKVTNKDLYFTATTNKKKVYEQEPIVLTYKFHSRVGVGLSNVMLRQKPDLKGFLAQEVTLPKNLNPTTEEHNGALYQVGTNLQYVLFPQQSGKLSIPGISFDCEVIQRNMDINLIDAFFNGAGNVSLKVQRKTPELQIEVLPLPSPKPANFSGGVGEFKVEGELLTPNVATHDLCTYRITVTGSGNMKLIKAPAVSFPKDFDAYDPKVSDKTSLGVNGITGEITYDYTFVPRNVGTYDIPATEFVYFNTISNSYETLKIAPLRLEVKQGTKSPKDIENELALRNSDINPLHTARWDDGGILRLFSWGKPLFFLLQGLLLILFFIAGLFVKKYQRANADVLGKRSRKANKKAIRQLKKARQFVDGNDSEFYAETERALWKYLEEKFAINVLEHNKEQLKESLMQKGFSEQAVDNYISTIDDCEYARFAPAGTKGQKEQVYEKALQAILNIDNECK